MSRGHWSSFLPHARKLAGSSERPLTAEGGEDSSQLFQETCKSSPSVVGGTRADSGGWPGAASGGAQVSWPSGRGVSVGPAWPLSVAMCSVRSGEARDPGVLLSKSIWASHRTKVVRPGAPGFHFHIYCRCAVRSHYLYIFSF